MAKDILCAFGVDVDAVAGWLGSYGGEDSPCDISRGLFSGRGRQPAPVRALRDARACRPPGSCPGHSIETFPDQTAPIVDAGHEIGVHGYSHENPIAMTREQETAILDQSIELIEKVSGRRPTGYVAPWWEFSRVTNEILLERGIKYDHSLMHRDFEPYYVRVGDTWKKIDYTAPSRTLDGAAGQGQGNRPRRDPGQLVPGRPAAHDVHQGGPELARLRQPRDSRTNVARPVRLGLPGNGPGRLHHDHPPGRLRAAPRCCSCSSA